MSAASAANMFAVSAANVTAAATGNSASALKGNVAKDKEAVSQASSLCCTGDLFAGVFSEVKRSTGKILGPGNCLLFHPYESGHRKKACSGGAGPRFRAESLGAANACGQKIAGLRRQDKET